MADRQPHHQGETDQRDRPRDPEEGDESEQRRRQGGDPSQVDGLRGPASGGQGIAGEVCKGDGERQ